MLLGTLALTLSAQSLSVDPANWMRDLRTQIGHIPLNRLAIPGTHDSGTSSLDPESGQAPDSFAYALQKDGEDWLNSWDDSGVAAFLWGKALGFILDPIIYKWAVAQDKSITRQLDAGIRYFDLRLCPAPGGQIRICHSLYGENIGSLLYAVRDFSLTHPDEIIILDFSHLVGHGISGPLSITLASSILTILNGMIIPQSVQPDATLDEIWSRPERIVVLYDDPDVPGAAVPFWPGQKVSAGSAIGGEARIFTPWPAVNDPDAQKAAAFTVLQCRCGYTDPDPGLPFVDGTDKLFVLQTNPTPDGETFALGGVSDVRSFLIGGIIGGSIIQKAKQYLTDPTLGCGLICDGLDALANGLGWVLGPQDLNELANLANLTFFATTPTVTDWVTANGGALRDNLNIVQADMFDHRYLDKYVRVEVPTNFVESMIKLNLPPASAITLGLPRYPLNSNQPFVTGNTPLTLVPVNPSIWGLGANFGAYSQDPTFAIGYRTPLTPYGGPFTVQGSDGEHRVVYRATNLAGVRERLREQRVTVDNTPPTITVVQPAPVVYVHSTTLTLDYGITDNVWSGIAGSGVQSVTPAHLDGSTTLDGHGLASGQPINLLTELSLGEHTFTFGGAVDNVGNTTPVRSVTFKLIATTNSIKDDVAQFLATGAIGNSPWAGSLLSTMDQAAAARATGRYSIAASIYRALINELAAQAGRNVTRAAADIITEDAEYLMCTLPLGFSTPSVLARTNPLLLWRNDAVFFRNDPACKAFAR